MDGLTIFAIVLLVVVLIIVLRAVRLVPQGYHYTAERFGRYYKTLKPGLNLLIPVIDNVGHKVNMMERVFNVPSQEVITKDNAMVAVDGVTFFQVLDSSKASYAVNDLENALLNLTMTNIRNVMGSMDLDELLSKRDEINVRLLSVVDTAAETWGVKVTRIEIKDILPPADLIESMGRQMKAERDKRANILEAEGLKAAEILRAEGERNATVLEAEGKKQAAYLEAEARERLAQAEAKAVQMVSDSISAGDVNAINYFVAEKYIGALTAIAASDNQKILMMPMETSGVIGSIAGIAELTKDMGKK
ncbi:MAG: SPFH/Band 7/PHB domain protein [Rhizobiales bacterium]|nr:SPFH/Band 7/PHB domain protein [Hyphomicrobiales bacterium]NRB14719.1 SPFH/Band 7/PHB domain protein [Hyphomicrobiales bacterium]